MSQSNKYVPPKVWKWDKSFGGKFASINRPISGAINDKELPVGEHPFQLYSVATPNGIKITVMFEELLELGISEAVFDRGGYVYHGRVKALADGIREKGIKF